MAQAEVISFGAELKDGYKPVDSWVANGIVWMEDIQQFYRERAAIERDYSSKLSALAKKYYDKKLKKSSSLSVGDTPSLTPGSLESASLTTWTTQLTTLESRAAEHEKLGQDLIARVGTPLEFNQRKFEELRKSHAEYQTKLLKERDTSYGDLKKLKGKYDAVCQDVENKRKKTESSFDSGRSKAANSYNQQLMEMHNVKNTYLIGINVTNKLKECYYHEYVPEMLDSLQDLNETRVLFMNQMWATASSLETASLQRSVDQMKRLSSEITRNEPRLDSIMFVRHNAVQWMDPPDFGFEPSPVWLDSDGMVVDETAKIFLRNILGKSKPVGKQLKADGDQKKRDIDNIRKTRQAIRDGRDKRDEVDCVKSLFAVMEELHAIERTRITAEVETATIVSAAGDLSLRGRNHILKSETFKIPTNCDLCGDRIWGLSAKGFICTDCGYTCHSKCELKVPADCPGELAKEEKKKLKAERQALASAAVAAPPTANGATTAPALTRQDTMNSLSSGYAANAQRSVSGGIARSSTVASAEEQPQPRSLPPIKAAAEDPFASKPPPGRNRIVAPPPVAYIAASSGPQSSGGGGGGLPKGIMLYPYEAREPGELTIAEGKEVTIIETDDGGWTKVRASFGSEGLVPSAYLEDLPETSPPSVSERPISTRSDSETSHTSSITTGPSVKKKGPAVAPRRGAKKLTYVEALYPYTAQTDAEFDMVEGERFILKARDSGDGWMEVEKGGESRSVPANYVQEV